MEQLALGQLHWSAANYAPFQEQALWDGLVAVYEQVMQFYVHLSFLGLQMNIQFCSTRSRK